VGANFYLHEACDLPKDVGCQGAAIEGDALVRCHGEVAAHLEDPRVGGASRNGAVSGDLNRGGKRVQAGPERLSSQISGDFERIFLLRGSTSCIRVGDLHVADCHGQVRRSGPTKVIGGVHAADDLRGCRRGIVEIFGEREACRALAKQGNQNENNNK
jgi:hypothetical protein